VNLRIVTTSNLNTFTPEQAVEGLALLLDKPAGWTSFDVVNKVRGQLRHRLGLRKIKVGHAGTLDPMATGLLIICTGKYTPLLDQFQARDKTYSGTITLGGTTATYDAESPVEHPLPWEHIGESDIRQALEPFRGPILQVPPAFSAIRIEGKRAYELARKGKEVAMEPRPVTIHQFDVDSASPPILPFVVRCSKGTYIRSLAHDLGQTLGCGAWLSALRRDAIGEYSVTEALRLEAWGNWCALPPA